MRARSSYRTNRKRMAREAGMSLPRFNQAYDIAARAAEAVPAPVAKDAAVKELAIWAANGGRSTAVSAPADLDRLNGLSLKPPKPPPAGEPTVEQAAAAAKKITVEDIDKAMESALTRWQAAKHQDPMPLSKLFAARARVLGWVEGVEFEEEK